jgi:hypothetical protein
MSGDENTTLLRAVQAKKPLWEDDRPYVAMAREYLPPDLAYSRK